MNTRKELVSVSITFVSMFLIALGGELALNGGVDLTTAGLFGLVSAAFRSAIKSLFSLAVHV